MDKISRLPPVDSHSLSSFKSLSKVISLFVFGVGCLVLIGWVLDITTLKSILPGLPSMKSNAALLFVLCGISLWTQVRGQTRRIAQACAFIVAFVALLTLGEYLFNTDFGIDELLFNDTAVGVLYPGRMAPLTALVFLMMGSALMFLDRQPKKLFSEFLLIIAFAISILALIGYIYGVSSLYKIGEYTSMALHTALNFVLLSIGILFARPERGLMQTVLADTAGGSILRRFLPVVIVGPILLGWVRLWGQRAGLYDTSFGLVLMVVSIITTLTIFIWLNAGQLSAMDIKRKKGEEELRANERRLHLAASAGEVGIWDWDVVKDELIWDESMYDLYSINKKDFGGAYHAWSSTLHPEDRLFTEGEIQAALRGEREYAPKFRIVRPDGVVRMMKATSQTIRDPDGKALRMIGTNIDITERQRAEEEILKLNAELEEKVAERTAELAAANEQLRQLSRVDEMTGLYNRRGFLLLAEEQLLLARRAKRNLLIFYADLDGLKQINDELSHTAGDEAIAQAARSLSETFRNTDIKARIGGDEFIVMAIEAEEHNAEALLRRLHEKLAEHNRSMSVGVVSYNSEDEVPMEDIIAEADRAMYKEKRRKPGRIATST